MSGGRECQEEGTARAKAGEEVQNGTKAKLIWREGSKGIRKESGWVWWEEE